MNTDNLEIYDGHIHTQGGPCDPPEVFLEKTHSCGIACGTIFSVHSAKYRPIPDYDQRAKSRIDWILEYTSRTPGFLPYFFADLSDADILEQIEYARKGGIRGYKVICDGDYSVGDHLEAIAAMAETGLPVMFHSGVDNYPHLSSPNNRPIAFEKMLNVRGLRFSLAHIGWPWCDEFVGIFAKFSFARSADGPGVHAEMYVDVTPGTPGIFRREAMRKLYLAGYNVRPRTFWGTDRIINNYKPDLVRRMMARDFAIIDEIERDAANGVVTDPYGMPENKNLKPALFSEVWKAFNKEP